jgi:hypothetical protein
MAVQSQTRTRNYRNSMLDEGGHIMRGRAIVAAAHLVLEPVRQRGLTTGSRPMPAERVQRGGKDCAPATAGPMAREGRS